MRYFFIFLYVVQYLNVHAQNKALMTLSDKIINVGTPYQIHSKVLGEERHYRVYLPNDYQKR